MKQIIVFLGALILIPSFAVADYNFSEMSYDELMNLDVALHQHLTEEKIAKTKNGQVSNLLYEDENMVIGFCGFRTEESSRSTYMYTECFIENKTAYILDVTCDNIIIDGWSVGISKYVEIPPKSKMIHEWMNGAEQYLKYNITEPSTFSMMFHYSLQGSSFRSESLISQTVDFPK